VDVKGQEKETSVYGLLKETDIPVFVTYVLPIDAPKYYVLDRDMYNGLVMNYWETHPEWASKNKPNGFLFSRLKPLVGGWQNLPGWVSAKEAEGRNSESDTMTGSKMTVEAGVKRGPESWSYIYIAGGFALTIESTVIGMMTPLTFPWNIIVFGVVASITAWLFIENGWFQNKLIGLKSRYENKVR
jgi:hypothetical protein